MTHKIKVMLSSNITREAVLINPSMGAGERTVTAETVGQPEGPSNVIATGQSSAQILKRIYGK